MAEEADFLIRVTIAGRDLYTSVLEKIGDENEKFNARYSRQVQDLQRDNQRIEDSYRSMGKNIPVEQKKIIDGNNAWVRSAQQVDDKIRRINDSLQKSYETLQNNITAARRSQALAEKSYSDQLGARTRQNATNIEREEKAHRSLQTAIADYNRTLGESKDAERDAADASSALYRAKTAMLAREREVHVAQSQSISDTNAWIRASDQHRGAIDKERDSLRGMLRDFKRLGESAERDLSRVSNAMGDLGRNTVRTNKDRDLATRGIIEFVRAFEGFTRGATRFGNIARTIFTPLAMGAKEFQTNLEAAEEAGSGALASLSSASRGASNNLAALYGGASLLATVLVGLSGALVAVAGSAVMAGAALGGALVAGIGQAIPVIGVLLAGIARIKEVIDVFQLEQQQQDKGAAATQQNARSQISNAHAIADAERSVSDARRGVVDANRAVDLAQQNLTQTRLEARRQLDDLVAAERAARLEAEQSDLSMMTAQRRLQELVRSGGSAIDIRQAQLAIQQQGQSQTDASGASARRQAQISALRNPGSSPQGFMSPVPAAQEQLAAARRRVADAERQVARAQEQVGRAGEKAAAGQNKLGAAQSKILELTSRLSPAQRGLLAEIRRYFAPGGLIDKVVGPVGDIIVRSVTKGLKRAEALFRDPKIIAAAKELAHGMGDSLDIFVKTITSPEMRKLWVELMQSAAQNLPILAQAFSNLFLAFSNVAVAAAPLFNSLVKSFADWTGNLEKGSEHRDRLSKFFATAGEHLDAWLHLIGAVGRFFLELAQGGAPTGLKIVEAITTEFNKWGDWIRDHPQKVQQFFEQAASVAHDLWRVLVDVSKILFAFFDPVLMRTFTDLLDLALRILNPMLQVVKTILDPFLKLIDYIVKAASTFDGFKEAVKIFTAIMLGIPGIIVTFGGDVVGKLLGFGDDIKDFFVGIGEWIGDKWGSIWGAIEVVVTKPFNAIKNFLSGAFSDIKKFFVGFAGDVADAWSNTWGGLKSFASGVWDDITGALRSFVNTMIDGINWITQNIINILPGVDIDKIGHWGGGKSAGTSHVFRGADVPGHAEGAIVQPAPGGVYRVAEAGHPEAVIPLDPSKRERALGLWKKTGVMLGEPVRGSTPGFAQGGIVFPLAGTRGSFSYGGPEEHWGRSDQFSNWESNNAWDIATPRGTPAVAVATGRIFGADTSERSYPGSGGPTAGYSVHLTTGPEEFWYEHMVDVLRSTMQVAAGQVIGLTGTAGGLDHLHWAATQGGAAGPAAAHRAGDKYLRAPVVKGAGLGQLATGPRGPWASDIGGAFATSFIQQIPILGQLIGSTEKLIALVTSQFNKRVPKELQMQDGGFVSDVVGGIRSKVLDGIVNVAKNAARSVWGSITDYAKDPLGGAKGALKYSGKRYMTQPQIEDMAASFKFKNPHLWSAIAMAESSGDTHNVSHNSGGAAPGSDDVGLWQLNSFFEKQWFKRGYNWLFDPYHNAQAAYAVSSGGTNPNPWTTYTSGAYRRYYGSGGIVEGPYLGAPMPIVAHAGERITPSYAEGGFTGGSGWLEKVMRLIDKVWRYARDVYPFSEYPGTRMPGVNIKENDDDLVNNGASVSFNRDGTWNASKNFLRSVLGEGRAPGDINAARNSLIHEWAHMMQNPWVWNGPKWLVEGGAQMFAEKASPGIWRHMGYGAHPYSDTYDVYRKKIRSQFGKDTSQWINHDQFVPGKFPAKKMHSGGVVPGAPGSEMLTILKAGETVTPAGVPSFASGGIAGIPGPTTDSGGSAVSDAKDPVSRFLARLTQIIKQKGEHWLNKLAGTLDKLFDYVAGVITKAERRSEARSTATSAAAAGIKFGPKGTVTVGDPMSELATTERELDDLKKDYADLVSDRGLIRTTIDRLRKKLKGLKPGSPAYQQINGQIKRYEDLLDENTQDLIDNVNNQRQAEQDIQDARDQHDVASLAHRVAERAKKLWEATHRFVNGVWTVINDPVGTVVAQLESLKDEQASLDAKRTQLVTKRAEAERKRKDAEFKYGKDSPEALAYQAKVDEYDQLLDENSQKQRDNIDAQIETQKKIGQALDDAASAFITQVQSAESRVGSFINVVGLAMQTMGASAGAAADWVRGVTIAMARNTINSLLNLARRLGVKIPSDVMALLHRAGISTTGLTSTDPIVPGGVPGLAAGDRVTAQNGGQIIVVGEGGYDEYVLSTDPQYRQRNNMLVSEYLARMGHGHAISGPVLGEGGTTTIGTTPTTTTTTTTTTRTPTTTTAPHTTTPTTGTTGTTTPMIWYVPAAVWNGWTFEQKDQWLDVVAIFGSESGKQWARGEWKWDTTLKTWVAGAAGVTVTGVGGVQVAAGVGVAPRTGVPPLPPGQTGTFLTGTPTGDGTGTGGTIADQLINGLITALGTIFQGLVDAIQGPAEPQEDPLLKELDALNKKYDRDIGLIDQQIQIDELNGDTQKEIADMQRKGTLLTQKGVDLQALLARTTPGSDLWYEVMAAINGNTIANLQNTKAIKDLQGKGAEPQTWASRAWQWFRKAIFNGLGELLPQFTPPADLTANVVPTYNTPSSGSPVIGSAGTTDYGVATTGGSGTAADPNRTTTPTTVTTNVNITSPTEVADPNYFAKRVAWETANTPIKT